VNSSEKVQKGFRKGSERFKVQQFNGFNGSQAGNAANFLNF
jgi:hypothetical protein